MMSGDELILRLRRQGMSYRAISVATREILGWRLTEHQVRMHLHRLGVEKNRRKARATRLAMQRRKVTT